MKKNPTIMKSYERWEEDLLPGESEALRENGYDPLCGPITANDVFDCIVEYKGGLSSGYEIRSLLSRVYGMEL